ncbi:MAG: response regulator transcription factor [Wenzhouxiangella sp.]|nr:response regulator transcription factor [Wenzhouxiangella sp.]
MKILIVDDDADLRALIGFALRQGGFLGLEAPDVKSCRQLIEDEQPDLVILDVNLPDGNGLDLCREIRERSQVPILMLTVRNSEDDLVSALELGADDFLSKPFSPRTLLARIRALLRRASQEQGGRMELGELTLDMDRRQLQVNVREPVRLTGLETRLMQILIAHGGRPVTSEKLITHVWSARRSTDRQLLKQLIHRLRQKIEADPGAPGILLTESGIGYRLGTDSGGTDDLP